MTFLHGLDTSQSETFISSLLTPDARFYLRPGQGPSIIKSPNNAFWAIKLSSNPLLRVYRTSDWSQINIDVTGVNSVFFVGNDYLFLVLSSSPFIRVYRTSNWTTVNVSDTLSAGRYLSPNGAVIYNQYSSNPRGKLLYTSNWSWVSLSSETVSPFTYSFSPDSKFLLILYSGSPYQRIYNALTGALIRSESSAQGACGFSADSAFFYTVKSASPYTLNIYRTSDWGLVGSVSLAASSYAPYFSSSGLFVATRPSGGAFVVRRTADWTVALTVATNYQGHDFYPDADKIVIRRTTTPYATVYNLATGGSTDITPELAYWINKVIFFAATRRFGLIYPNSGIGPTKIYDMDTLALVATVSVPTYGFNNAVMVPDGSLAIVWDSEAMYLCFYNPTTFALIGSAIRAQNPQIKFSEDGLTFCLYYQNPDTSKYYCEIYRKSESGWSRIYYGQDISWVPQAIFGNAPTVKCRVLNPDGTNASVPVYLMPKGNPALYTLSANTDPATGVLEMGVLAASDHIALVADQRTGSYRDPCARVPALVNNTSDPVVLRLSAAGSSYPISGNATKASGLPVDSVVVFDWSTEEVLAKLIPELDGNWTATVPAGLYGITYLADGCAPVTHGPYTVSAT